MFLTLLIFSIYVIVFFIMYYRFELKLSVNETYDKVQKASEFLYTVHDGFKNFLIEYADLECIKEFNYGLDKDVEGKRIRVYAVFYNYRISVADFYFYYEKAYKNRKEFIWYDKENDLGLNYFEKLVTKLMRDTLRNQLKKKLLD